MATAHDGDPAPEVKPPGATRKPAGLLAALSAIAGCAALVGSLFLPRLSVTRINGPGHPAMSVSDAYAWASAINVLLPLLLLPAGSLVVSTRRSFRRGGGPTGDALALAIFGVVATLLHAFLLALASTPWLAFGHGGVITVSVTPAAGLWVALAGSIVALAGVIAARILARRAAA